MNEKLNEIIAFLKEKEGWNKKIFIQETAYRTEKIKEFSLDEIGLVWGCDKDIMSLEDFLDLYTEDLLEAICNVLESFKESEE